MQRIMNKSDLRTGMKVEYEDGSILRVMLNAHNNEDLLIGDGEWNSLDYHNDDLTNQSFQHHNIIKVYKPVEYTQLPSLDNPNEWELIWQKPQEPQYTLTTFTEAVLAYLDGQPIKDCEDHLYVPDEYDCEEDCSNCCGDLVLEDLRADLIKGDWWIKEK